MLSPKRFHSLIVVCIAVVVTVLSGFAFWQLRAVASLDRTLILSQLSTHWQSVLARVITELQKQEDQLFKKAAEPGFKVAALELIEGHANLCRQLFLLSTNRDVLYPPIRSVPDGGEDLQNLMSAESGGEALFDMNPFGDMDFWREGVSTSNRFYAVYRDYRNQVYAARQSKKWLAAGRVYERAARDAILLPRTTVGALVEGGRMYEKAGQLRDAQRVYTQLLYQVAGAIVDSQDVPWAGYYRAEAVRRLRAMPAFSAGVPALLKIVDPAWVRAVDRAALRKDLREWVVPAVIDAPTMPPARSVIIGPSGRAVVRYGPVDSGAGQTLGYLVNLPVFARLVYSRLQDQGPFLEVLLPSGTVIATAGDPLPVGTACTVANLPLDDWLKGCVLRLTTSDTEVSHTVRRYAIVRISMLIGMVGLAGIGLITLWVGISRQMELTRLKSEFIANVSHELKTPLALIRIIGESLRLGRVADEGKRIHYYEVLAKESHRLTTLINNVLDFSRIDQGRKEYQRDLHQPRAIAEPIFDAYTMHLQKSGFITRFEAPDDLPKVLLDPEGYAQVLVNLIDNAEKFSDTVKDITVRLAVQDDIFLTEVADRGIGIPPEEASRIFERFYRARSAVKRQIRGTGIGLNLAQHVAEAHGGRLQVSPREGGGTVFRLAIPL